MKTFICIASGPSLTRSDCLLAARTGHPVIAVNSSWRRVPECTYIYAGDFAWWEQHRHEIPVPAECWTCSALAAHRYGLNLFAPPRCATFNSGMRAIQFAAHLGATRIVLLGYDCAVDAGTHWHGDHPGVLKNPDTSSVLRWREEFQYLAENMWSVEVINCSRRTTLTSFTKSTLERVFHA